MEVVVDPTTELELATVQDMATVLVHREVAPPGVVVWLAGKPRMPHLATFGDLRPCHMRYLAAVLLGAARHVSCDDDGCSD